MATYIPQYHHSINANFIARPNYGQARIPFSNVIKSNQRFEWNKIHFKAKSFAIIATRSVPNHKLSFLLHTYFLKIKYLSRLLLEYQIDTVQDFLIKLGIKTHMHILEISIVSLNHVIVRPTKIIKDLCKATT